MSICETHKGKKAAAMRIPSAPIWPEQTVWAIPFPPEWTCTVRSIIYCHPVPATTLPKWLPISGSIPASSRVILPSPPKPTLSLPWKTMELTQTIPSSGDLAIRWQNALAAAPQTSLPGSMNAWAHRRKILQLLKDQCTDTGLFLSHIDHFQPNCTILHKTVVSWNA